MDERSVISRIKELGTREAIAADPRFAGIVENVLPLAGTFGNIRQKKKTLGEGSYGRVNLEEVNEGEVATKYFTDTRELESNVTELAVLKDVQGLPNVAQLIRVNIRPAGRFSNAVAPPLTKNLPFPAAVLGKGIGTLDKQSLYTSWDDVYSTVIQVLRGYAILHAQGIVHRDTKPANMLMTAAKEVWISDFGMAKYTDTHLLGTNDGYTGTYRFSAPELLMKKLLGKWEPNDFVKSDAYAVGCSLYMVLTGRYFLQKDSPDEIIDLLFAMRGEPEPSDGILYPLFLELQANGLYLDDYPRGAPGYFYTTRPDAVSGRIETRCVHPPADPAVLTKVADVIERLMTYDPVKRLSCNEALVELVGAPVPLPPRRRLLDSYMKAVPIPASIPEEVFRTETYEVLAALFGYPGGNLPYIIDRSLIYTKAYLNLDPTKSWTVEEFQYLLMASMTIAEVILNTGELLLDYIKGAGMAHVQKWVKKLLLADIQFCGRTLLDELILERGLTSPAKVQTLGFLNYLCLQNSIYELYEGKVDMLKKRMWDYLKFTRRIRIIPYFDMQQHPGAGTAANPHKRYVLNFLDYMREPFAPLIGGRRCRRRQTRRRRSTKRQHTRRF